MASVEEITEHLSKYMKGTKEEKQLEEEMKRLLHQGMDKERTTEELLKMFDRICPNDVKQQIYKEIDESF